MKLPSNLVLTLSLATLSPAALLPETASAQAEQAVVVGQPAPADKLHIVTEPGRYGLGPELPGSHYAVVGDQLIRIDAKTNVVQSIIRKVDGILD